MSCPAVGGHRSDRAVQALARELGSNRFAGLVDAPLNGGQRRFERVCDLRERKADHVAQNQRHLQVGAEPTIARHRMSMSSIAWGGTGAAAPSDLDRARVAPMVSCLAAWATAARRRRRFLPIWNSQVVKQGAIVESRQGPGGRGRRPPGRGPRPAPDRPTAHVPRSCRSVRDTGEG